MFHIYAIFNGIEMLEKIMESTESKSNNKKNIISSTSNNNNTMLMYASKYGSIDIVNYLLEQIPKNNLLNILNVQTKEETEKNPRKKNTDDIYGYTALIYAIKNNHKDIVEILIENGADIYKYSYMIEYRYSGTPGNYDYLPNREEHNKKSALDYAVENNNLECVILLINKINKANIFKYSNYGEKKTLNNEKYDYIMNAYKIAINKREEYNKITELFRKKFTYVIPYINRSNIKEYKKKTKLDYAVEHNKVENIKLLIKEINKKNIMKYWILNPEILNNEKYNYIMNAFNIAIYKLEKYNKITELFRKKFMNY